MHIHTNNCKKRGLNKQTHAKNQKTDRDVRITKLYNALAHTYKYTRH